MIERINENEKIRTKLPKQYMQYIRYIDGACRANYDIYIDTELKNGKRIIHQAIEVRKNIELAYDEIKKWPRLSKALRDAGLKTYTLPRHNRKPLHYKDEIIVLNGKNDYFRIKRDEIGEYLAKVPLNENAIKRQERQKDLARILNLLNRQSKRIIKYGNFCKITLVKEYREYSIAYPVLANSKIDEKYLESNKALTTRVEKKGRYFYLMPSTNLANEVRKCDISNFFKIDHFKNEQEALLINSDQIIIEVFDRQNSFYPQRVVYDFDQETIYTEEYDYSSYDWKDRLK